MTTVPTVRIVDPDNSDDYCVINESDFDPDKHELLDGEAADSDSELPELPEGYSYGATGGGWVEVLDADGETAVKKQGYDKAAAAAFDHEAAGSGE